MPRASSPADLVPGTLEMLILQTLTIQAMHGYAIDQWIEQRANQLLEAGNRAMQRGITRPAREAGAKNRLLLVEATAVSVLGGLVGLLTAAWMLQAMSHFVIPGSIRLDVYGSPLPWEEALSAHGGETPFVCLHGMVAADEMPRRLASASALLLLQPDPAHAPYIAGKLYEYLGARRPVVAALPAGCEAERLLRDYGDGRLVRPLSVEALEVVLSALLAQHRAAGLQGASVPRGRVEPLTRREQSRRLARVFDEVTRS